MKVTNLKLSKEAIQRLDKNFLLREGKVLKGEVIALKGKKLTLKIGTTLINAETKVPLSKGQILNLLVESVKNNFITLKIIPKGEKIKPESILLSRLGIKPEETQENIVRELTKYKMPVTLENLKEIGNTFKFFNLPREVLPLLVWLKSTGINVNTKDDVLELLKFHEFFQGKLSEKEEALFKNFLNKLESDILGGYNIYSWSFKEHKIYLFTTDSKSSKKYPGNSILILRLKSQKFGDLWFKILYQENNLKINLVCENREYKEILQKESKKLQNNLLKVGYNSCSLLVEVREVKTIFDFLPKANYDVVKVNYKV